MAEKPPERSYFIMTSGVGCRVSWTSPKNESQLHEYTENRRLRKKDVRLDGQLSAIQEELVARRGAGAIRHYGPFLIVCFLGEDELAKRWWQAHLEADARELASLPELRVKPGDDVCILGQVFRISSTDKRRREVHLSVLDRYGSVVGGDFCRVDYPDGRELEPMKPGEAADSSPDVPSHIRSGLDAARHRISQTGRVLVDAGLADADDY